LSAFYHKFKYTNFREYGYEESRKPFHGICNTFDFPFVYILAGRGAAGDENCRIIASKAWVDYNGGKKLSRGDIVQLFGVVAAGRLGAGRFVAFGDDAVFQNRFLDDSNRRLATNLARWLK
jgi:hypothetical protein